MSGQRRKALSEPVTILINAPKVIDVRGATKFCAYPASSTEPYQLVSSLASGLNSTAHSAFLGSTLASTAISAGTTYSVAANFYYMSITTTSTSGITPSAVVHTVT
jgi:hypothetical protein